MQISVSATKIRGAKLPKEAIAYIAVGRIKVEDEKHESNIKKGEKFYLMEFRKKFFLIDVEGKDLYKFPIDEKTFKRLSKKHTPIAQTEPRVRTLKSLTPKAAQAKLAKPYWKKYLAQLEKKNVANFGTDEDGSAVQFMELVNDAKGIPNHVAYYENKGKHYVKYTATNSKKRNLPAERDAAKVKVITPVKAKVKPERDEKNGIIGKRGLAAIRYMDSKYPHLESGYNEEGIYLKLQEGISPAALRTKIENLYDNDSKLQELLKATGFDGPKFHSYGIDSIQRSYASLTFT